MLAQPHYSPFLLSWMDHSLNYLEITLIHKVQCFVLLFFIIITIIAFQLRQIFQLFRTDDAATATAYNGGFEFKDAVKQADEYAYDKNGNMTKDLNKDITDIQYNCLNLPSKVTFKDGSTITYTYALNGTKLRTVHKIGNTTTTTDYCGNVVYENGVQKLLLTDAGYITLSDKKYHYYLQDHQGNNRVIVDQTGQKKEVNHYYPFGGTFASADGNVQAYKYNGKELDTKKG